MAVTWRWPSADGEREEAASTDEIEGKCGI